MFVFGLHSTSDDQLAGNVNQNTKKMKQGPLSHGKIKFLYLDYVQLLMIGQVI